MQASERSRPPVVAASADGVNFREGQSLQAGGGDRVQIGLGCFLILNQQQQPLTHSLIIWWTIWIALPFSELEENLRFLRDTGSQKYPWKGCVGIKSSSFEWARLLSSKLLRIQLGTKLNYKMQLKLDPRNAIPVLELVPNLLMSEIFKRLTTSAGGSNLKTILKSLMNGRSHRIGEILWEELTLGGISPSLPSHFVLRSGTFSFSTVGLLLIIITPLRCWQFYFRGGISNKIIVLTLRQINNTYLADRVCHP